jgi:hypothetical protein
MAVVTELITKFSFQGSTAPLADFNEGLGGAVGLLSAVTGALVATSAVINTFVISTLSGADAIGQLAINTNVSVVAIQELGYVASVSGSSAAAMESSIANLSQTIGDAAQKGNEDFARLGISVRDASGRIKTADVILDELRDRFRVLGLSMQEQQSFAQALGIDPSLVQLLGKTSAEMNELRKRARDFGLVTDDQQKSIIAFNDSFTTLRFGMDAIGKQIAIGLSPAIKEMAEQFTDFLTANKDLIIDGFIAFGDGVTVILQALDRLKFVIGAMIGLFLVWKISAIGLGAVLGTIFSPIVLITAGIVALLVIIDDLIVAMNGGKSVIRDFFLEFFGFDIKSLLEETVEAFKLLGKIIVSIFKSAFALVTGDFSGFIDNIKEAFTLIGEYIGNMFSPIIGLLDKAGDLIGFGGDQALAPGGNTALSTNNTVAQDVKIEIVSNDPEAVGQAVADSLQSQLSNANTQLQRGGR